MNPLNNFNNGNVTQNMNSNPMQMVNQFMEFAKGFQGNPEQKVQELLANGTMTQEQLNQIIPMARQAQQMLNQFGIKL